MWLEKVLLEKVPYKYEGWICEKTIDVATQNIEHKNFFIHESAFQLFKSLLNKKYEPAFKIATNITVQNIKNENSTISFLAFQLLSTVGPSFRTKLFL